MTALNAWEKHFSELKAFRKEYGHCRVPSAWPRNRPLAHWVQEQRLTADSLSLDCLKLLVDLEFDFGSRENQWFQSFFKLLDFKNKNHHINPTRKENKPLREWVQAQRARKSRFSAVRIDRLNEIGFQWQSKWEETFSKLKIFVEKHGHFRVPKTKEHQNLHAWLRRQKIQKTPLPRKKIQKLDSLGDWQFRVKKYSWEERYQELKAYREKFGDCRVPKKQASLAKWIIYQRSNKGRLSKSQIERLELLGLQWEPRQRNWNPRFEELKAFKKRFGHCKVPHHWYENPKLATWVRRHRDDARYHLSRLDPVKVQRLNELGFAWTIRKRKRRTMEIKNGS